MSEGDNSAETQVFRLSRQFQSYVIYLLLRV